MEGQKHTLVTGQCHVGTVLRAEPQARQLACGAPKNPALSSGDLLMSDVFCMNYLDS